MNSKIAVSIAAVAVGIIAYGFGEKVRHITDCTGTVKKYVTAEFSEFSCDVTVDYDGNTSTDCGTDYWSEAASETYYVNTLDDSVQSYYGCEPQITKGSFYTTCMPPVTIDHSNSLDFDKYQQHTEYDFKTYLNDGDYVTGSQDSHEQCLGTKYESVTVKYWYFFNYDMDL